MELSVSQNTVPEARVTPVVVHPGAKAADQLFYTQFVTGDFLSTIVASIYPL